MSIHTPNLDIIQNNNKPNNIRDCRTILNQKHDLKTQAKNRPNLKNKQQFLNAFAFNFL